MSLLERSQLRNAVDFFRRGLEATPGVVRLSATSGRTAGARATGWLVTPTLVVVPTFVLSPRPSADDLTVAWSTGDDEASVPAHEVWRSASPAASGSSSDDALRLSVALLEIPRQERGRSLAIRLAPVQPHQQIAVLHHPRGDVLSFSAGAVLRVRDRRIAYDASTDGGSSGAPIFDADWNVVGVHVGTTAAGGDMPPGSNFGMTAEWLVECLRAAPQWSDIAAHQRLVDPSEPRPRSTDGAPSARAERAPGEQDDPAVLYRRKAAVRWDFDPEELGPSARRVLAGDVADAGSDRWALRPDVRSRVLREAGSLAALREARGSVGQDGAPQQRVIDRILEGGPIDLDVIPTDELPVWIPAVRWFSGSVDELPSSGDVSSALERRRVRERLEQVRGAGFEGRKKELAALDAWYERGGGPLVVSGLGGVGKSALIAQFVLSHPAPFAWIDFDRADVAPDDAPTLLAAVVRQVQSSVPGVRAPSTKGWEQGVRALAKELAAADVDRLLLVLDSFEAAQYEGRHAELWPFLEAFARAFPPLRVLISGRAPVPGLVVGGAAATPLHLSALDPESARRLLLAAGVTDEELLDQVIDVTRGLPLNLRLAAELVRKGETLRDLSTSLPQQLIQGYLYRRILRRVTSEAARRLARGALVVRRLTEEMAFPVLGNACDVTEEAARQGFRELVKELALVEGSQVLRRDVRNAVLHLLEAEDRAWVKSIDAAAERWYAAQDTSDPDVAAELVYHRLRLGDLRRAAAAWRDGVALRLGSYAVEEVPAPARAWLERRLSKVAPGPSEHDWEADATGRIRDALRRELWRAVTPILEERKARSSTSALPFLEAYALWKQGRAPDARRRLAARPAAEGPAERDRAVMRACLAEQAGDFTAALSELEPLSAPELWEGRRDGALERAAIVTARVRLLVDLGAEARFAGLCRTSPFVSRLLSEADLVQRSVQERLHWPETRMAIDISGVEAEDGNASLEDALLKYWSLGPRECLALRRVVHAALVANAATAKMPARAKLLPSVRAAVQGVGGGTLRGLVSEPALALVVSLAWSASARWHLAARGSLFKVARAVLRDPEASDPKLATSLLATLQVYTSRGLAIELAGESVESLAARRLKSYGVDAAALRVDGSVAGHRRERRPKGRGPATVRGPLPVPSPLPRLVERLVEFPDRKEPR
jgi:hypothetical protein